MGNGRGRGCKGVTIALIVLCVLGALAAIAIRGIMALPPPRETYTVRTVEKFDAEGRTIQTTQTTITKGLS